MTTMKEGYIVMTWLENVEADVVAGMVEGTIEVVATDEAISTPQ